MADTNEVRQARKRAHAAGDHSRCVAGRCPHARSEIPELRAAPDPGEVGDLDDNDLSGYGPTTRTAIGMVATLPYAETDPRFVVAAVTLQLAQEFDRAPTAILSAEIRRNSNYLLLGMSEQADILNEIRAKAAKKTAELLIRTLATG